LEDFGKFFILLGVLLVIIGIFLYIFGKLPFNLGDLPGDLSYRGEKFSFYFPITTSILISIVLSFFLYLFSKFLR
jgi:hypothetical protein